MKEDRIFLLLESIGFIGTVFSQNKWEWADWVDNALVFAEDGCLYKIKVENRNDLSEASLLHDFNGYRFENRQAPY